MTTDLIDLMQTEPTVDRWGRKVSHRWLIGGGVNHYGEECTDYLVLSTYHHSSMRRYSSTLNIEQAHDNVVSCAPLDAQRIHVEECNRYSAAGLAAAADNALAAARALTHDTLTLKERTP